MRPGMQGWLAAACTGRLRGDEGNRLAPVVAALEEVWTERGWSRPRVDWIREKEMTVTISIGAHHDVVRMLSDTVAADLARRVGAAGVRVRPTRTGAVLALDHVPPTRRGAAPPEASGDQQSPALLWGPASPAHPFPLLVPLGTSPAEETLHVNLAELPTLLVATGPLGTPAHPLLALVTAILVQASPTRVRLLVAGEQGSDLDMLRDVPHLVAPLADAEDPTALGEMLTRAEEIVVSRILRHQQPVPGPAE